MKLQRHEKDLAEDNDIDSWDVALLLKFLRFHPFIQPIDASDDHLFTKLSEMRNENFGHLAATAIVDGEFNAILPRLARPVAEG